MPTKRAIISVHDKTGIADFARGLAACGFEIVSSGGTAKHLREQGIAVTDVADVTGFPEMLDGRVKTLHPKVHAGILARRDVPGHMATIAEHGILPVDVVCVNLYPFEATVAKPNVTEGEAIEQIDIGGPSLVRAAAKNFSAVAVVTDPAQYGTVLAELQRDGAVGAATKRSLFQAAFALTARYDAAIAAHFGAARSDDAAVPESLDLRLAKALPLRYGENPHQPAGFYLRRGSALPFQQLHGKEISYNNILDLSAAWELAAEYDRPCCAIVKHTNPCGLGCAEDLRTAYLLARDGDLPPAPISRYGGIIAVNRPLDRRTAEEIAAPGGFYEVIAAPSFADGVREVFAGRKGWGQNVRLVEMTIPAGGDALRLRSAAGGVLVQAADGALADWDALQYATAKRPTPQQLADLKFAFAAVKHVKSNAIVIARDAQLVGLGAGQPNRVASVRLAAAQAGERARGAVLASDGFFPFPDNVEEAAAAGIAAIVQPGGSVKDAEAVAAAERLGIAMVLTGIRHFRH